MLDFRQLRPEEGSQAEAFLSRYPEATIELTGRLEKYGVRNSRLHKREGDWFGAFTEGELTGLFTFSNHRSFLCHYTDPEILKRVALLKTLRQYAPKNLSGTEQCMAPIYDMISKTLKDVRYAQCWQMTAPETGLTPPEIGNFCDARQYDLNRAMEFLIEAEKAFGRKPRMNSDLRTRIMDREEQETYLFLLMEGGPVAQGMIEYQTGRYGQISAVYTARAQRGRGYGALLMQELMERVRMSGRQPALIVEKKNAAALRLYERLGFVKGPAFVVINVEME